MKKIIALLICLLSLTVLISCDGGDDTPEGMQLVFGGEDAGYYFYAPEEWVTSSVGEIKAAYIAKINTTSVSFTEVKLENDGDKSDYFFNSYFNESLEERGNMKNFTLKEPGKEVLFGSGEYAAKKAKQYVYTYEYLDFEFSFMQILVENNGKFYIFTYSAQNTAKDGETPNYEKYLEKARSVIESFRFVKSVGLSSDASEYERDEDGYILISDKKLSGFSLYVPESFKPDYASAIVSATHKDGSNVNITKATYTGLEAEGYWEKRKEDLSKIFSELTSIKEGVETELGNSDSLIYGNWDWAYEYTYVHEGEKYHVYQILAIDNFNGYVFTYTAKEENYATHLNEILKVIEKVRF